MPELGQLESRQIAALASVAPYDRQSGSYKGKSRIKGGRHHLRKMLFMPTLNAARHNPDIKAKYEALVETGKPKKVALVAAMRKILITANALVRDDREWCQIRT